MPNGEKSTGALVGSIIIIVILVIGAVYIIGKSQMEKQRNNAPAAPAQPQTESVSTPSAGPTDLNSMQNDLNTTGSGINSADQGVK